MAAKFRKIDPRIWHDEKFKLLSAEDKLVALNCLTSPQVNRAGIFFHSIAMASDSLGMKQEGYRKGIGRVCEALKWEFERVSGVLYLPTWWKYNGKCGPKTMSGNLEDLHDLPQTLLLQHFFNNRRYLTDSEYDCFRRVSDTHGIRIGDSPQEKEQEQEQEKEKEQDLCAESEIPTSAPNPSKEVDSFKCSGNPKEWLLLEDKLEEWRESFPHLDVVGELRKARQWLLDNPNKQKTARGMTKYLGGWLGRAQDRGKGEAEKPKERKIGSNVPTDEDLANYNPHETGP